MIVGFWGLSLEGGKSYSQEVDSSFKITMASLGAKLPAKAGRVSVTVTYTGKTFTLCSLTPEKCEQQPLDITFMEGEEVTFATQGADCVVDLTGNYVMDLDDGPEDDEYDSDDMMQLMGPDGMEEDEEMSGEDEEEWEDEEDEIDAKLMNALANKMKAEAGKITEVGSDDEEEEEEEDEDEDEEMEESPEPEVKKEEPKKKQEAKKAEPAAKKAPAKAEAKKEVPAKAEVKKDTPAKAEPKKEQPAKSEPKTEEKPAKVEAKKEASNNKKTLPSGLVIEDGKVGNGPRAKNGKKVCVRYIGKLASNDKIFDSNTKGSPFTFRLGAGDVIKGWDLGVQGMNVGGTRILTIPPKLAYGARGAPPDIPKNATLIFEIKLLEIKN